MYLFNFLPHWVVCGILVPNWDQTHNPLQWKFEVLTLDHEESPKESLLVTF